MLYRKCLRHYGAALLLGLLLAAGVSGCGETEPAPEATELPPAEEAEEPQASAEREISWEPVTVTTSGRGEVCFDLRPEHFIRRYNQLYRQDWGEDLLQPLDQWMDYGVGFLSRSGGAEGHQYVSQVDESNYAEPFLSLCVTQDGARVMETVTGLSQKNYDGGPIEFFQAKAFYSLRVFFPAMERADFDRLYEALFAGGSYTETYETPLPNRVFYQDGVACYATLQIGECDQIHVMAVTQAQLDQWRAAGVEVTEGFPAGEL